MFKRKNGGMGRVGVSIIILLALASCGPAQPMSEDELARRHHFKPAYQVEHTVHRQLIPLDPVKIEFKEQERRDLYNFLVGVGAQPGDRVVVASRRTRLDHRGEIVEFVRRLGLKPDLRQIKDLKLGAEDDGYDNAVLIQFNRYVTRDFACGEWKDEYSSRFNNVRPLNFGCTTTAALQQQVAYPSSLIAGQPLEFPEGDVAADSVSRYRLRNIEQLQTESAAN